MFRTIAGKAWLSAKPHVFGVVGLVAMLNLAVAVLAFAKDLLQASYFGTSVEADALTLAYFLSDTIGNSLLASALGVACVPAFSRIVAAGSPQRLRKLARTTVIAFTSVAALISVALLLFKTSIARWIAGSGSTQLSGLTEGLLAIVVPIVFLFPAIAIGASLLQSRGSFAAAAAIPMLPHIVMLAVMSVCMGAGFDSATAVYAVAWSITIGVGAMGIFAWTAVARLNPVHADSIRSGSLNEEGLRTIGKAFLPYLSILLAGQAVFFLERAWASGMETGTAAGLNYAFRLSQMPIWVIASAVYSVMLPSLSKDVALGRGEKIAVTMKTSIGTVLLVTLTATSILYALSDPIVELLFQRGAFDDHSVRVTSDIVQGYSLAIPGMGVAAVCIRYFLAAGRMAIPLWISIVSSVVNAAADYGLKDHYGAAGLGYGAAIGASLGGVLFLYYSFQDIRASIRVKEVTGYGEH